MSRLQTTVASYLVASTGILVEQNGLREFVWFRGTVTKCASAEDFASRAKNVFELLPEKVEMLVIINTLFLYEKLIAIVNVAEEYARKVKVIDPSMAKLMNVFNSMRHTKLNRGDTIFVTTFPYNDDEAGQRFTDGDYFVVKRGKSRLRLINHGYLNMDSTDFASILHDHYVFISHTKLAPMVQNITGSMSDRSVKFMPFDRYDFFLQGGALQKGWACLGFNDMDIDDYCLGIEGHFKTRSGTPTRHEIVSHGQLLPCEIRGICTDNYVLMFEPQMIKDHNTLRLHERNVTKNAFDRSSEGKLLFYINSDGIPMDHKPPDADDWTPRNSDEYLSETDTDDVTGQWKDFPFHEKTKLIVCVDLESGLVLFQDYRRYGKPHVKRFWAGPRNMTKDTCGMIILKLPKIFKYSIISIVGNLDEDSFKHAIHLNLFASSVIWIPKLKAELSHVVAFLGNDIVENKTVNVMVQRDTAVQDYYVIENNAQVNNVVAGGRTVNDDWNWLSEEGYKLAIYTDYGIGEGKIYSLEQSPKNTTDCPDGVLRASPEELRLFGALADAKLQIKKCDYQKVDLKECGIVAASDSVGGSSSGANKDDIKFLITIERVDQRCMAKISLLSFGWETNIINPLNGNVWTPLYFALVHQVPEIGHIAEDYLKSYPRHVVFDFLEFVGKPVDEIKRRSDWGFGLEETDSILYVSVQSSMGTRKLPANVLLGCTFKALIKYAENSIAQTIEIVDIKLPPGCCDNNQRTEIIKALQFTNKTFGTYVSD